MPLPPTPSDLDFSQCIQGAYDDAKGRLRVDAAITAPIDVNGEILVDIRAEDHDSVLIAGTQDGTAGGTVQYVKVNPDGSLNVNNVTNFISTSANLSSVTSTIFSQTILPSNINRRGFILYNDSNFMCYVAFAATSSSSAFSILLNSNMTYQNEAIIYTGVVSCIWNVANGFLRVTELV
jgi:hypothetical protein